MTRRTIENNTVNAWNDTLIGGAGNDIMVGDAMFFIGAEDNYIDIQLNQNLEDTDAEKQTEMSLFNDLLCGGDGNDMMFGDFSGTYQFGNVDDYDYNYASNTEPYEYELTFIDDNGQLIANMFNDTLRGDAGDDMLYGQLGDDVLVGGEGADTFVYEGSDNWEYSVEYTEEFGDSDGVVIEVFNDNEAHTDGHDTIQDFNHILEGDFINLDELFDNLGIWQKNDRAEQVNIEDNVITVEGIENFSITVQGDTLDNVSAGDNYNYDQLFDMGIDVGGIVLPVDVS
ncbi:calcium-binding protein [Sneathiella glossodoripedis]|uniref:calcium-binding protein n=1 Tax=Sneathiella glossodoripedis TaxID=418853 RepID=UPI00046F544D|nr:calcium-binding protein [Sneathiella glossodoripedis]